MCIGYVYVHVCMHELYVHVYRVCVRTVHVCMHELYVHVHVYRVCVRTCMHA